MLEDIAGGTSSELKALPLLDNPGSGKGQVDTFVKQEGNSEPARYLAICVLLKSIDFRKVFPTGASLSSRAKLVQNSWHSAKSLHSNYNIKPCSVLLHISTMFGIHMVLLKHLMWP